MSTGTDATISTSHGRPAGDILWLAPLVSRCPYRLTSSSHSPAAGVAGNDRRAGANSGNASTGDPSGPSRGRAAALAAARYLFCEEPQFQLQSNAAESAPRAVADHDSVVVAVVEQLRRPF